MLCCRAQVLVKSKLSNSLVSRGTNSRYRAVQICGSCAGEVQPLTSSAEKEIDRYITDDATGMREHKLTQVAGSNVIPVKISDFPNFFLEFFFLNSVFNPGLWSGIKKSPTAIFSQPIFLTNI